MRNGNGKTEKACTYISEACQRAPKPVKASVTSATVPSTVKITKNENTIHLFEEGRKNAIQGIHKKAVITCNSKKVKAYKKLFSAASGYKKTMNMKKAN